MKHLLRLMPLAAGILFLSCGEVFSTPNVPTADKEVAFLEITPVRATACCQVDDGVSAMNLIDGHDGHNGEYSTWWKAMVWDTEEYGGTGDAAYGHDGRGHFFTVDLGQVYSNISRITFMPEYYLETSWDDGYPANRNGVPREYEIYVTETKPEDGELAPPESLAAYGIWECPGPAHQDYGGGPRNEMFDYTAYRTATFASRKGRYVQFRFISAYHDHWSTGGRKRAAGKEFRVFLSTAPYDLELIRLKNILQKVDGLRLSYPKDYGFTDAMLDRYLGKAEACLNSAPSQEEVNEVTEYLINFVTDAAWRIGNNSYNSFVPKRIWADNNGSHIQAHGSNLIYIKQTKKYWLYGEDRTPTGWEPQPGLHAYSSDDMYNWKDEGLVCPVFNNTDYDHPSWGQDEWDEWAWNTVHNKPLDYVYWEDPEINPRASPEIAIPVFDRDYDWKKWVPSGNPDLYVPAGHNADPHPSALGLDSKKMAEFNALYSGLDATEKKLLYRFFNHNSIQERPKVIFHEGPADIEGRTYGNNEYGGYFVLWIHIEGGFYAPHYGVAKVLSAVSDSPAGPFRILWGSRIHYQWDHNHQSNPGRDKGMSRDMSAIVDDVDITGVKYKLDSRGRQTNEMEIAYAPDGVKDAYIFSSTEENRVMCISLLDSTYTRMAGVPYHTAARGKNIGNKRAPDGMALAEMEAENYNNRPGENFIWTMYSGVREAPAPFIHYMDGITTFDSPYRDPSKKRFYNVHSGSEGWQANGQASNHQTTGWPMLGYAHDIWGNTGWSYTENGSILRGKSNDGYLPSLGYNGQTNFVFQLRYPPKKPDGSPEPREGQAVYGKYIWMADEWHSDHLYDSLYIWLPLKMIPKDGDIHPQVRWLNEWRWEDFIYDTGPFAAADLFYSDDNR